MNVMARSRFSALLILGLIPIGLGFGMLWHPAGLDLLSDWVAVYLLPLFFFGVGAELRGEFVSGYFVSRRNLVAPGVAATLGVAAPALLYFLFAGPSGGGWAVPTATDITIGLAVLALARPSLSSTLRPRFLALATIDDVIALIILATVFSQSVQPLAAMLVIASVLLVYLTQKLKGSLRFIGLPFAASAFVFCALAGIQTSLVGVALGLVFVSRRNLSIIQELNSWVVLPLFTFFVSASAGASLGAGVSLAVLFGLLLRPIGKFLGIAIGGAVTSKLFGNKSELKSWSIIGVLGGIGFTVSLLLARLAFKTDEAGYVAAVLATLAATCISAVVFLFISRSRQEHRDERSL